MVGFFVFVFCFGFVLFFCFINELLVERASQLTFAMFLMFRWAIWSVFYVNSRSLIGANLHYVHRGRTARFEFTSCMCFFLLIYILYLRYGFGCQGARKFRCLDFYFFDSKQTVANAVGLKSNENFLQAHNPVLSPFVHINI